MRGWWNRSIWAVLSVGALVVSGPACREQGNEGAPEEEQKEEEVQPLCNVGPSPIRRMTRREYDRTVHDLINDATKPGAAFPDEEEALGFNNNANAQSMSPVLTEKYLTVAEDIAERAVQNLPALTGCDPVAVGEEACAKSFIERFGKKAFRRPLTSQDVNDFLAVYNAGRSGADFKTGVSLVVQTFLQSPEYLYRIEEGAPVADEPGVTKLNGYEVASRLSYFLWGTMPDEALMNAAEAGELDSPEGIEAHARRMLLDGRAQDTVREFHAQWLGLARIADVAKDTTVFPDFDPAIRPHLRAEADALIDDVMWRGSGDLTALFTAKHTYLNGPLATFYGVHGVTGDALQKVERPADRAAGLLSQGGMLAVHAHPDQTSPVLRGKFVREQLLCQAVPPPPEGLIITPPSPDKNATTRERFAQHRADPACQGCHAMMDPVGFGFERFDSLGRYRDAENGVAIDDSGEVSGTSIGAFKGISELGAKLAAAPEVQQCVARQWFRFAQGRAELTADLCTVESLQKTFSESNLKITELMVALTRTRPFRFRTVDTAVGGGK